MQKQIPVTFLQAAIDPDASFRSRKLQPEYCKTCATAFHDLHFGNFLASASATKALNSLITKLKPFENSLYYLTSLLHIAVLGHEICTIISTKVNASKT
jgi:hypothetical protein